MDLAELKARIKAVYLEINDLRAEFSNLRENTQGLAQSDCREIAKGIAQMRSAVKRIEEEPLCQAAVNQIFYYNEARSLFNAINDIITSENVFEQCVDLNTATIKRDSSFKISSVMIQAVHISFYHEHVSSGGEYLKTYCIDQDTYIQWNQSEMQALLDLYLDWHTEDENAIQECVEQLLNTLSDKICNALSSKYYFDEIVDIPEWIRVTGQDRPFNVTISDTLLSR